VERIEDQVQLIVDSVRAASTADYSARLRLLEKAAQTAREMCRKLGRREARGARPAFFAVLEMALSGTCAPQCCEATYVRAIQIAAKCEVLATWRNLDPGVAEELSSTMMAALVIPSSRRIALATVELLERSPAASRTHMGVLIGALEHPRWQVAQYAARSLGKMGEFAKKSAVSALNKTLRHSQWQVRKAAAKAMGQLGVRKNERLERMAHRDSHRGVRYSACKALGLELPRS